MPDFSLGDATAIITPETVIPVLFAGLALGYFFWRLPRHVYGAQVISVWTIGIAFLAIMGTGRWVEGSPHWSAWIGTAVLWSLFVGVGGIAVLLNRWRYQRMNR